MTFSHKLGIAAVCILSCAARAQSADPAPAKKPPISACALLSQQEVSAILGVRVMPGEQRDSGDVGGSEYGQYAKPGTYSSTCLWRVAAGGSAPNDPNLSLGGASYAILNAMQWANADGAHGFLQSFYDAAKDGTIDNNPVPLKIADEALWWGDGVAVRKGSRSFGISVHMVGGRPKERGMEESLAKEIAPRA